MAMATLTESQGHAAEFAAARGDRSSGWLPQSRSEVLARNGMVATSQPLAAEAGLQIFMPDVDKLPPNKAAQDISMEWLKNRNTPPPASVMSR